MLLLAIPLLMLSQEPTPASDPAPAAGAPAQPEPVPAVPSTPESPSTFFDDGQPGHYLQWYGAEYVALVGAGSLLATDALDEVQPLPALIGPSIDLDNPDTVALFD